MGGDCFDADVERLRATPTPPCIVAACELRGECLFPNSCGRPVAPAAPAGEGLDDVLELRGDVWCVVSLPPSTGVRPASRVEIALWTALAAAEARAREAERRELESRNARGELERAVAPFLVWAKAHPDLPDCDSLFVAVPEQFDALRAEVARLRARDQVQSRVIDHCVKGLAPSRAALAALPPAGEVAP